MTSQVYAFGVGTGDSVAGAQRNADVTGEPVAVHYHHDGEKCSLDCVVIDPNPWWDKSQERRALGSTVTVVTVGATPVHKRFKLIARGDQYGYYCLRQGCTAWYVSQGEAERQGQIHVTLPGGCW